MNELEKAKRKTSWLLVAVLILVGLLGLCGVIGIAALKSPTPTPTQEKVVATSTQAITFIISTITEVFPTATEVVPTATEVIPTATEVVPTETEVPVPTADPTLTATRGEGTYLVGSELAVGHWRITGNSNCYSVLKDQNGDALDMASGPKSILNVTASAYMVQFISFPDKCQWEYIDK